jgi:hypothetical protein
MLERAEPYERPVGSGACSCQRGKLWLKAQSRLIGEIAREMQALRRQFAQLVECGLHLLRAPGDDYLERRAIEARVGRGPVTIEVARIVKMIVG